MSNTLVQVLESQLAPYNKINTRYVPEMLQTVAKMTAPGKGLLAADESVGSVAKRFAGINLPNTEENRRQYRLLFLGAAGIEQYISGVIFHEETLSQKTDDGKTFPEFLASIGVIAGIKTDQGLADLEIGAPGEQMTLGLDGYLARAKKFYDMGARFCKWRNTYKIQNGTISEAQVQFNAQTLARYAALSQIAGLVPIVEPEVMIDGNHTIEQCQACSQRVWSAVAAALHQHGVILECMLLKPNMIVPGAESGQQGITAKQVGDATVVTLARCFQAAIPGVTFLSGGLSEVQASEYLNAMNVSTAAPRPWRLTFSYARALQSSALKAWGGKAENFPQARKVFLHRAKMNSKAQLGQYNRSEDDTESQSLFVKGHTY